MTTAMWIQWIGLLCILSPESCLRRLTCACYWLKGDRQVDGYTCVVRKQKQHFADHFPLSESFIICVYCSCSSIYVLLQWSWLNSSSHTNIGGGSVLTDFERHKRTIKLDMLLCWQQGDTVVLMNMMNIYPEGLDKCCKLFVQQPVVIWQQIS